MNQPSDPQGEPESAETPEDRRKQAILRCTQGALSKAQEALERKYQDLVITLDNYRGGYCRYLPEICDYESARDFIACVVYGMGIEAIGMERGTKLLYGAQVALTAFRPPRETK